MRSKIRDDVFRRDDYTCQYCARAFEADKLTIDHLIPMASVGLDEPTNFVTCCYPCNQKKDAMPLEEFARTVDVQIEELPVHGDPVIDNESLPVELRMVRKRVFDRMRAGEQRISGTSAQKRIEKAYRRDFWQTAGGQALEKEFPNLPGHVRIILPEIQAIASNEREYLLLIELAKSANTRNLIGTTLTGETDIKQVVEAMKEGHRDLALRKKLEQAWKRFEKELKRRNLRNDICDCNAKP